MPMETDYEKDPQDPVQAPMRRSVIQPHEELHVGTQNQRTIRAAAEWIQSLKWQKPSLELT